eukprot:14138707-Ditylum_brightwellii.AAC.2
MAYKLQKRYNPHMSHKPKHVPACKWIARVIRFNNYLTEFPMPPRVVPKNIGLEEILEILEN